jgi:hypothetical protein
VIVPYHYLYDFARISMRQPMKKRLPNFLNQIQLFLSATARQADILDKSSTQTLTLLNLNV